MQVYRAKVRLGATIAGSVVGGYQTSVRIRTLKAEGYRPSVLCKLVGVGRATVWRHLRSAPVREGTAVKVKAFWLRLQGEKPLDKTRGKVVEEMLNSLGRELSTHASAWQDLQEREPE
jgi:hypothetical protein